MYCTLSAVITLPRVSRLWLMFMLSRNLARSLDNGNDKANDSDMAWQ
jgi:hypothetical protein